MEESFESEWEVKHTLMGGGRAACAKDSFFGGGEQPVQKALSAIPPGQ